MKKCSIVAIVAGTLLLAGNVTAQWSVAHLSQARHDAFPLVVGQKVLFIGGEAGGGMASDVVDIYDGGTGAWSVHLLPSGTRNLEGNPSVVLDDKAVVVAGGTISLYNATTGEWTPVSWPEPRAMTGGGGIGHVAVIAGGYGASYTPLGAVDIYNAATDEWSVAQLSEPRALVSVAGLGSRIFIAGGIGWIFMIRKPVYGTRPR